MFERYTEQARRALFFARYETSQLGAASIEPEHILLGVVRQGKGITGRILGPSHQLLESLRRDIEGRTPHGTRLPTSVEIPFSVGAKRVLEFTADEADRMKANYIGAEHLLLGILREDGSVAASLLAARGFQLEDVRQRIAEMLGEHLHDAALQTRESREMDVTTIFNHVDNVTSLVMQLAHLATSDGSKTAGDRPQELVTEILLELHALKELFSS